MTLKVADLIFNSGRAIISKISQIIKLVLQVYKLYAYQVWG